MKKLPPAKRNQLILVILATAAALCMVYFFLIGPQKEEKRRLEASYADNAAKVQQIKKTIQQAAATAKSADEIAAQLNLAEADVATGDVYAWTYDTIRRFKSGYKIEIPNIGSPAQADMELIPNFPYKQIKFTISGTGFYHDLGKFVSDLENKFPHIRVLNVAIEPAGDQAAEKLLFRMEIAALVKSNA
jgi:Tfp pilus assembly protein PilO